MFFEAVLEDLDADDGENFFLREVLESWRLVIGVSFTGRKFFYEIENGRSETSGCTLKWDNILVIDDHDIKYMFCSIFAPAISNIDTSQLPDALHTVSLVEDDFFSRSFFEENDLASLLFEWIQNIGLEFDQRSIRLAYICFINFEFLRDDVEAFEIIGSAASS